MTLDFSKQSSLTTDAINTFKNYVNSGGYQSTEMIVIHAVLKHKKFEKLKKSFCSNDSFLAKLLFQIQKDLESAQMREILNDNVQNLLLKETESEKALAVFFDDYSEMTCFTRREICSFINHQIQRYFDYFVFKS